MNARQIAARKGHASRRINIDARYRLLEPRIKAMRESGSTWYAVAKQLNINYITLRYLKENMGMAKYGEGK